MTSLFIFLWKVVLICNQAFKEIARGEQTAATLESNLSSLEAKLDAMLAGLEQQEKEKLQTSANGGPETDAQEKKEIQDEENELKMDLEETDELKALKGEAGGNGKGHVSG